MSVSPEHAYIVSSDLFRLYYESIRLFRTIFIATTAHIDVSGMYTICYNYLSQTTAFLCRMLVTIIGTIFEFFFTNSFNRYQLPPDAMGGGRCVGRAHNSHTRYGNDNFERGRVEHAHNSHTRYSNDNLERGSLTTTHEVVISRDAHGKFGITFRQINGVVTLSQIDNRHVNLIDGDVVREFNGVSINSLSRLREVSSKMDDAFLVIERQIAGNDGSNGDVNTDDVNPTDITLMEFVGGGERQIGV